MNRIISDFFQLGTLRFISRALMGLRGLFIVVSLSPYVLGEYTIWLLFIFYFSILDFGVLAGLERDIPHYKGLGEADEVQRRSNIGWSTFFVLSGAASLLLGAVSFFIFGKWALSVLLGVYLFADKVYRAYEVNARIHFLYKESGTAQLFLACSSLTIIWIALPRFGVYGIFMGFIMGFVISACFLWKKCRLNFTWGFHIRSSWKYIKGALPLAVIIYSIQFHHMAALTILAFLLDKSTLGYFAFAFRIFQICLALFPFLIQEVMRTRMYYHAAQAQGGRSHLEKLFFPMGVYCVITSFFWVFIYWWADWGIGRFASTYVNSIGTLKLLVLALLPLGISKICSDYLCSHVHKKISTATLSWLFGIALQGTIIFFVSTNQSGLLYKAPIVYLISTLLIYVLIGRAAFKISGGIFSNYLRLIFLLMPLAIVLAVTYMQKSLFHLTPTSVFSDNLMPFVASVILAGAFIKGATYLFRHNDDLNVFFVPRS